MPACLRIAAVALIAIGSAHVAIAQETKPAAAANAQSSERYRIGAGDVLEVRVYNRPQLSRDAVRVEGNGMIRMPLIDGDIQAACKTEGELAKEISTRYARYYRNLPVDVFIKEYHAREVALIGAVNEQGRYQMQRHIRLLELLTFAKGPSEKAGQTINIVRAPRTDVCEPDSSSKGEGLISLRLNDTLRGDEGANPYVEAGDIITIPEAEEVYVVGNVYAPKSLPLKESLTVSRAIAMAGGPLRDSKTDRVHVVRHSSVAGSQSEIYVNLTAIARKKEEDLLLQPNDIIEVQESTGKSLIRSLIGAVAPSVAQMPVRVIP
ncbi:MAG TPA: polysaccharide biosynthesis/export family protein [Pyrinomonadaceae bacterium]|nr:polysaccharide biosynthesis/export family protein [Pyrinomonadaceae bacterium]